MNKETITISDLLDLASALAARSRRAIEAGLRKQGITYAQHQALKVLAERDGLSQAELAVALDTDATTAMVLRGSLEKKGLVVRSSDEKDGRIKRIALTSAGKSMLTACAPAIAEFAAKAGELVSEAELKRTAPLLVRLGDFADAAIPRPQSQGEPKRRGRPPKAQPETARAESPEKRRGRRPKIVAPAAPAAPAQKAGARKVKAAAAKPAEAEPKRKPKKRAKKGAAE